MNSVQASVRACVISTDVSQAANSEFLRTRARLICVCINELRKHKKKEFKSFGADGVERG